VTDHPFTLRIGPGCDICGRPIREHATVAWPADDAGPFDPLDEIPVDEALAAHPVLARLP
jgi:hypothetical protein